MNPYQVLGVSKAATQDEIKNAYRSLAKKYHPDLNPGNKNLEAKFKEVAQAYELVGTSEARAKYDRGEAEEAEYQQQRASRGQRGPSFYDTQREGGRYTYSFGGEEGAEDVFENLFRGMHGGRPAEQQGEDHLYQMEVDFKDSVLGAEREITLPHGKKLQVKIPAGIETGAKLRFRHQGGPGVGSAPPGDAYVEVTVRPLAGFKRVGNDIEVEVPISFIEGILGAEIQVPTIDASVMLKVPAGVSTGSRLRIRGKGVAHGKERGDQLVVLKVVLPKKVNPELQEVIRGWGEKYSYNPRAES
ncbi:MAG: J domain-containing protein [Oligoflexia bacterium]|nr:J domain-containing protein [Oligoflexia bacterium]